MTKQEQLRQAELERLSRVEARRDRSFTREHGEFNPVKVWSRYNEDGTINEECPWDDGLKHRPNDLTFRRGS